MSLNVLIVDDSSTFRSLVSKTLGMTDLTIDELHEACDGQEALEVLRDHWIDLVLVDVNMPVMNGGEMIDCIRQDPALKETPIILLTSEGSTGRVEQIKSLGIQGYVRKPCAPEELIETVESVIGRTSPPSQMDIVARTFGEVMQNLAFVFCDENTEHQSIDSREDVLSARIQFEGPWMGEISLTVGRSLAILIASNLMGTDGEKASSKDVFGDALGEVLNVTCGHALTAVTGDADVPRVSVPVIESISAEAATAIQSRDDVHSFVLEGRVALLGWVANRVQ